MTKYYKFLTADNTGEYSGFDFTEYLPKNGKPGKWLPLIETIEECGRGYHFCDKKNISDWCNSQLFEVEYKGKIIHADKKHLAQQMRFVKKIVKWNDKNARLAACDIAEQIAMKVWNKYYPEDLRPQNAIDTSRRFANSKTTKDELAAAAAGDAAWAAARAAAGAAAWDAANKIICKYAGI